MATTFGLRRLSAAVAGCGVALGGYMMSRPVHMSAAKEPALSPKEFRPFTLSEVERISHDTARFRFKLDDGQPLGLTVASCLVAAYKAESGEIVRPYTPTTGPEVMGHFDLVIKKYHDGAMTPHIFNMKPGDTLLMKGPFKKIDVTPNMKREIAMVAGGTGITPMYQVVKELLRHPEDQTKLTLVFVNKSEKDILLKDELDALAKKHPRFTVHYGLDKAEPGWKGFQGHINREILEKTLPKPSGDIMVFVCGPPGLMNHVSGDKNPDKSQGKVEGLLKAMGYDESNVYKF